ncbi:MAG: hypothetical protein WD468_10005 [Pirellulales bacterium]
MIPWVPLPLGRFPWRLPPILTGYDGNQHMSTPPPTPREVLDRLDVRQDELIEKLDELNAQIEAALAEFARSREQTEVEVGVRKAA